MTFINPNSTIVCKGKIINLCQPKIMGIVNITPDSFYAPSRCTEADKMVETVKKMVADGADFIDLGACSTRPGSEQVSETEELNRINFALETLTPIFKDVVFSVDTYRSKVAEMSVKNYGVSIINDISGGMVDKNMFKTVADNGAVYVLSHIKGNPQDMQNHTDYPQGLMQEILQFFSTKIQELKLCGVNDIIIDPGFGFSKTLDQNYQLLKNLRDLEILGFPIMVGVSRKSMIFKLLDTNPENSLNGTTIVNTLAIINGAKIIRVHDVKQAYETIKICQKSEFC